RDTCPGGKNHSDSSAVAAFATTSPVCAVTRPVFDDCVVLSTSWPILLTSARCGAAMGSISEVESSWKDPLGLRCGAARARKVKRARDAPHGRMQSAYIVLHECDCVRAERHAADRVTLGRGAVRDAVLLAQRHLAQRKRLEFVGRLALVVVQI